MLNHFEIVHRIKKIMDYKKLHSAAFAELIGVPRSAISHILSGRNKPSLEFVLKIEEKFTEVDLNWLIHGKGLFPKEESNLLKVEGELTNIPIDKNLYSETPEELGSSSFSTAAAKSEKKEIDKIVIFYKDQSFECFEP